MILGKNEPLEKARRVGPKPDKQTNEEVKIGDDNTCLTLVFTRLI